MERSVAPVHSTKQSTDQRQRKGTLETRKLMRQRFFFAKGFQGTWNKQGWVNKTVVHINMGVIE